MTQRRCLAALVRVPQWPRWWCSPRASSRSGSRRFAKARRAALCRWPPRGRVIFVTLDGVRQQDLPKIWTRLRRRTSAATASSSASTGTPRRRRSRTAPRNQPGYRSFRVTRVSSSAADLRGGLRFAAEHRHQIGGVRAVADLLERPLCGEVAQIGLDSRGARASSRPRAPSRSGSLFPCPRCRARCRGPPRRARPARDGYCALAAIPSPPVKAAPEIRSGCRRTSCW